MFIDKPQASGNVPKHVLALSWNIATEPKLYWELAPNPYTSRALQIISERFPGVNSIDIIKAVILAEPEGRYDINFKILDSAQQEAELRKQKVVATKINKQLVEFCKQHAKEFKRMPKEFIYDSLSKIVFAPNDEEEIEQRYAQYQRRDFKLSIVNLIEDTKGSATFFKFPNGIKPFAIAVLVILIGSSLGLYVVKSEENQKTTGYQEAKHQVLGLEIQNESKALPVRLKIPSINVDANIQHIGVSTNGEMEVPSNTSDVGWFAIGPSPGDKGSAVIAGHFNGENGIAGVFADLHKLKKDDMLYVEDDKGTSTAFVVRENRTYVPGYAEEVFSRNDGAHLSLITCEGTWDEMKKSYSERLVVFADIEN